MRSPSPFPQESRNGAQVMASKISEKRDQKKNVFLPWAQERFDEYPSLECPLFPYVMRLCNRHDECSGASQDKDANEHEHSTTMRNAHE
jgi:hypothetical protein